MLAIALTTLMVATARNQQNKMVKTTFAKALAKKYKQKTQRKYLCVFVFSL